MPCQLPVVAAARLGHEQCSMVSLETHLHGRLPHGCIFVGMFSVDQRWLTTREDAADDP
jgi:hypothetical protein